MRIVQGQINITWGLTKFIEKSFKRQSLIEKNAIFLIWIFFVFIKIFAFSKNIMMRNTLSYVACRIKWTSWHKWLLLKIAHTLVLTFFFIKTSTLSLFIFLTIIYIHRRLILNIFIFPFLSIFIFIWIFGTCQRVWWTWIIIFIIIKSHTYIRIIIIIIRFLIILANWFLVFAIIHLNIYICKMLSFFDNCC